MFHVIPENFFSPLASPNKVLYWDCICKLFSVMDKQLSFGVERDILVDELQYYFEQSHAVEVDKTEFAESGSRAKANAMLRSLERFGWIEVETDKSYVQRVNFKEYAVRVLKTLLEIADEKQVEYQGYIYTIYSLVRTRSDDPGVILLQIVENTDLLITGLKNLNSNIKHYIDDLTKHQTVAQIMDALFHDYMTNIVDKAYHRLLTSDNVSKFRPEIIERLEEKSRSKSYIQKASERIAELKDIPLEEAPEMVYQYLHLVIEAFRNMDEILNEINQKNTQYQKAAVNRARFLLTGSEDVRGQLKEILLTLNEKITEEQMDLGGIYEIDFLDQLIQLYHCAFLDEKSFYAPIEGKKEFRPQPIAADAVDESLRQEKMERMMEKMRRILSPEKITQYVTEQMGEKQVMLASSLPLETVDDFIKIIYIRLYGQRKNMSYQIAVKEERNVGGFRFQDFEIWKKNGR